MSLDCNIGTGLVPLFFSLPVSKLSTFSQRKLVEQVIGTIRGKEGGRMELTEIQERIIWNNVDNSIFFEGP
jgi:hypothetical protein